MLENELKDYPDLMSPMEVAELLKCSESFIRKEINKKRMKALKISRKFRIPKVYLLEYLESSSV